MDILAAAAAKIDENNIRKLIDLHELMKLTKFSKQEIRMLYRTFKQERYFSILLPRFQSILVLLYFLISVVVILTTLIKSGKILDKFSV